MLAALKEFVVSFCVHIISKDYLHVILLMLGRGSTFDVSMYDPGVVDTFQAFC